MTKIDIISGFLGSGKTTLIKKLMEDGLKGEKLVLIENEFGEIGIDGGFLKDAGVQITEMNSGCICCSLVGDFGTALKEVIETYAPDRIMIEPSGVGKLSDVIKAVLEVKESADIVLNSATTVVDCMKAKMYMKNFGEFFNNQVESAGVIILSRTQKVPALHLEECVSQLKAHNEKAVIITTPWDEISGEQILKTMEHKDSFLEEVMEAARVCPTCGHVHEHDHHHEHEHEHHHEHEHEHHHDHDHEHHHEHDHEHHHEHDHEHHHDCGHDHHHHHADDVFTSWGEETPRKYAKQEVQQALEVLANTSDYGTILRAKGILPSDGAEWIYFDLTPGEYEIRTGKPDVTGKLCVIGTDLQENGLKQLFQLSAE